MTVVDQARRLPRSYFSQTDTLQITRELLGKLMIAEVEKGKRTAGRIVETEAYLAPEDVASHAYQYKYTKRTSTMFLPGGVAYVYLCYGIHAMFNIITREEGLPHAILIRAVEPLEGLDYMMERRNMDRVKRTLTAGPGCLTQAMGIHRGLDTTPLDGDVFSLADGGYPVAPDNIRTSPRIGIPSAGSYRDVPWRFYLDDNKWVSRP
jgi:DNA-3-methyladenine glycosylase